MWIKIIIPVLLGLVTSLIIARYNARQAAEMAANAHALQIKKDREETKQKRDLVQAQHELRINQLEKKVDKSSDKLDELSVLVNDVRREIAGGFGRLNESIENLKKC